MLHEITIKPRIPSDGLAHTANGTEVLVDGKPFHGITSVYTDHVVDEVPRVSMTILPSKCDVETCADLNLRVDIDTVQQAIKCIQFALRLDDELYGGVINSVESVLNELHKPIFRDGYSELAKAITDRVFGLD